MISLENEIAFSQMSEFDLHRLQCKLKKRLDSNPNISSYKAKYDKNSNTVDVYIKEKPQIKQISTTIRFF